jgi:uncharacterized membrane protein YfcA
MEIGIAIVLGAAAGLLAGLFGVGGGILFVPTLTFTLGLDQLHAQATSLLAILPTVMVGAWRQHRYGNVRWSAGLVLGLSGVAGVVAGGFIAESLPQDALQRLFGALMIAVAAQIVWRVRRGRPPAEAPPADLS